MGWSGSSLMLLIHSLSGRRRETVRIGDGDENALRKINKAVVPEFRESAADRFDCQAKEVGDVVTRHGEYDLIGARASPLIAPRQSQQETCNALAGRTSADREQQLTRRQQLFRNGVVELQANGGVGAHQIAECGNGQAADARPACGQCGSLMLPDGAETNEITRIGEVDDLTPAVGEHSI